MSKSSFDAHLKDYFEDGIDETKLTNHSEAGLADQFHDQRVKVFSFDSDLIPIQHILKLKESSNIEDYYHILTDLSQVLEDDDRIIILLSLIPFQ